MSALKISLWQLSIILLWTSSCASVKQKSWKTSAGKYIILNTGAKVPLVGYGTWQSEDKILEDALEKALEAGYRHIDTASFYKNEHVIGNVVHKWNSTGKVTRDELFITTKLPQYGCKPELVSKYFEESLRNLKVDYIDLYLIHMPFYLPEVPQFDEHGKVKIIDNDFVAVWKEMEAIVGKGKAKAIGISNFNEKQIEKLLAQAKIKPAVLQVELHAFLQQKSLVEFCKKHNIAMMSYSTLGSRGTYQTVFKGKQPPPSMLENETVLKIAKKHNKTPAQILLRFMTQQDTIVIPKSTNEKRIKENHEIFDFHLKLTEMNELRGLDQGEKGRILRMSEIFKGLEKHPNYPFPY